MNSTRLEHARMCLTTTHRLRFAASFFLLLYGSATAHARGCGEPLKALIGQKVEFPNFHPGKWKYLVYFVQKPESLAKSVDYKKLVGKRGTITDVFPDEYDLGCWAKIEVEGVDKPVYLESMVDCFEDIYFPAELDSANALIGNTYYWRNRRGHNLGLIDANDPLDGGQPHAVPVYPAEPMKLIDVTGPRGWYSDCFFLLQRGDSTHVLWHGPLRSLNVSERYPETFFDHWLPESKAVDMTQHWSDTERQAVAGNEIRVGMTPDMVRLSQGDPGEVKLTTTADGVSVEWYYFADSKHLQVRRLIVFQNEVVSAIRDE